MTETKKRGRPRIEDIKEEEQKSDSQNSQIDELNDKIQELTANLSNIESKHVKSKNNKGEFNILTTIYVIHHDGSFNRAKGKIVDDSIICKKKKYMITSQPLKMTNRFGFSKLMYFCSEKTGSTIDFSLLFANKAQFDARTHELWFDKIALQNALKIQKTNPANAIAFAAIGIIIGIFLAGSGILG